MEKFLKVTFLTGETWQIPAGVIARDRAAYYANKDAEKGMGNFEDILESEMRAALDDDYELIDWAQNNLSWENVSTHAQKIAEATPIRFDRENLWNESPEMEVIGFNTIGEAFAELDKDPFEAAVREGQKIKEEKIVEAKRRAKEFISEEMPDLITRLFASFGSYIDTCVSGERCEGEIENLVLNEVVDHFQNNKNFTVKVQKVSASYLRGLNALSYPPSMDMTVEGLRISKK